MELAPFWALAPYIPSEIAFFGPGPEPQCREIAPLSAARDYPALQGWGGSMEMGSLIRPASKLYRGLDKAAVAWWQYGKPIPAQIKFALLVTVTVFALILLLIGVADLLIISDATIENTGEDPHTQLETFYFVANVSLPFIAVIGGVVAYWQLKEAKNSRRGEIYMTIVERWNAKESVENRKLFIELTKTFPSSNSPSRKVETRLRRSEFVRDEIAKMESDPLEERKYLETLFFFEDLGILCRKNYIREEDMFDFIGDHILVFMEDYWELIKTARQQYRGENERLPSGERKPPRSEEGVYANALYLYYAAYGHRMRFYKHKQEQSPGLN
jgi:hypothetical protein